MELPPVPEFGRGRPRLAAQRIHPRRLARGHLTLWARTRAWAVAADHPSRGKAVAARGAGVAAGTLVAWRAAHTEPQLLAAAAGAYAIAAWRTGRPIPPVPPSVDDLKRRVLLGVRDLMGDQDAVFLRDIYDALQARPAAAHLDDIRLRAVLTLCGLSPKQVRIGTTAGRLGIRRADVDALLSPASVEAPPQPVDAGHNAPTGAVDQA